MPTNAAELRRRYLVAGQYAEDASYRVARPQGSHDWLLLLTLRGAGLVECDGCPVRVEPSVAVLLPPKKNHAYATATPPAHWTFLWAHFVPPVEWRRWLDWGGGPAACQVVKFERPDVARLVEQRLTEAAGLAASPWRHREAHALTALQAALQWCAEEATAGRGAAVDPRIATAAEFVCRGLDRRLTVASIARHCRLSPSRLAHLFARDLHTTPMQYVEQQRLERARALLEREGAPVAKIARSVGFADPFYFSRRFKLAYGVSPRDYRRTWSRAEAD